MANFLNRIIRSLFTAKSEDVVITEDLQRDIRRILQEDKELSELVALLSHQETLLARLTPEDYKKIKGTQIENYPKSIIDAMHETEEKIARLFNKRSKDEEDFRELLEHLKEVKKKISIGRNLDKVA